MNKKKFVNHYISYYKDINFERKELFQLLQSQFRIHTVLYPGSSVHITPSFYFPHVVYNDTGKISREFFSSLKKVRQFIESRKNYKQSSYIKFINSDYTKGLGLRKHEYDLLISLYSNRIVKHCCPYLKNGGLILLNNFNEELPSIKKMKLLQPEGMIRFENGKYQLKECKSIESYKKKKSIKTTDSGITFVDTEVYYLFRYTQ